MSETKDKDKNDKKAESTKDGGEKKSTLSLGKGGTLSLKGGAASASAGRPRLTGSQPGIAVEVRRSKRVQPDAPVRSSSASSSSQDLRLTDQEREARAQALQKSLDSNQERTSLPKRRTTIEDVKRQEAEVKQDLTAREREIEEMKRIEREEAPQPGADPAAVKPGFRKPREPGQDEEGGESMRDRLKKAAKPEVRKGTDDRRARITVSQALSGDYDRDRGPSLAAQRRAREKARLAARGPKEPAKKIMREVILPETITVQELANRMAEPGGDVVKALMKLGVMAKITQSIDADTAELLANEFGHKIRRVTDADVEIGLEGTEDTTENMKPRPPVVTVMGHVDHGKTSLLDALRETDVASGEAGGITQHIGAYQVTMKGGDKITFLDTPGHAAFSQMRARGANVTDIVVIVVSAEDSVMPQTVEAINHARAAGVPIIVAINKIDLPNANPQKIKQDLLQHEVVIEDMGGDVQCVEVSAKNKINLDKLEEAILLQAEVLELKANPEREAHGFVIESKQEKGRGSVASVLIQKGTLRIGDIFVAGAIYGKVRILIDDHGKNITEAIPGQPVEVIGLNGSPEAGDSFIVVPDENKAREISEYRQRKSRQAQAAIAVKGRTTIEDLVQQRADGKKTTISVIIKADVHGSIEAIAGSFTKMADDNADVGVQVIHSGVGGITESDVNLAKALGGVLIGFNVRANAQARELAQRESVEIRYYNVIYNVIDDIKAILTGMLAPSQREEYLGQAAIRQVFNITKVGKVAGCVVTIGVVKRGAKVRLLRDDIVIHEGTLKTLQRFKDEVKEVKEGTECGMAFENYDDIKENDVIECYDVIEEARTLQ